MDMKQPPQSEDIEASQKAGMNGHIAKPIDINKMIATLNEVLSNEN